MSVHSYKEFNDYVSQNGCNFDAIRKKALELLENDGSRLGYDVYNVYEQLIISSVFLGEEKSTYLDKLKSEFSDSDRVNVLFGLVLEKMGRYDDAINIYEQITESHPYPFALKRIITITKLTKGDSEVISLLVSYLKIYMNDFTAWMELTDMYIKQKMYERALFCVEELILLSPNQTAFLEKYAQIVLMSKNDIKTLVMARKYLCFALCIDKDNINTLKLLVCQKIEKCLISSEESSDINLDMLRKATQRLEELNKK